MSNFWKDFAGTMVGGGDYWAHRAFGDNRDFAMRHTLMGPWGYNEQFGLPPFNNPTWGYGRQYDCYPNMYDRYLAQQRWPTPYCDFARASYAQDFNRLLPSYGCYNRWW